MTTTATTTATTIARARTAARTDRPSDNRRTERVRRPLLARRTPQHDRGEPGRDAFRRLVDREGPAVVRACYRVLGDIHEAEDAAQEAFVTAYRSLPTWRGDGPFGAWLTRIGVRIALRQAGRRKAVAWLDPAGTSTHGPTTAALTAAAVDAAPVTDPLSLSVRSERTTAIRRAVARLGEPYRETVSLRFFGELSLDEIARQTGRPLGTVKTHLHRGLQRLKASLDAGELA